MRPELPDDFDARSWWLAEGGMEIEEAAEFSGVSPDTIRKAINRGELMFYRPRNTRVIRVPRRALVAWMAAGLQGGGFRAVEPTKSRPRMRVLAK